MFSNRLTLMTDLNTGFADGPQRSRVQTWDDLSAPAMSSNTITALSSTMSYLDNQNKKPDNMLLLQQNFNNNIGVCSHPRCAK